VKNFKKKEFPNPKILNKNYNEKLEEFRKLRRCNRRLDNKNIIRIIFFFYNKKKGDEILWIIK